MPPITETVVLDLRPALNQVRQFEAALSQASRPRAVRVDVQADTKQLDDAPQRFRRNFDSVGPVNVRANTRSAEDAIRGLGRLGTQVAGSLAAAFGGIQIAKGFTAAASSFADFESNLFTLRAILAPTVVDLDAVRKVAIQLGNDITLPGVSASDAAQALTELAKRGIGLKDSIAAVRTVLQLATAAELDNGRAAEIVASSLNAFGLAGEQAIDVANLLTGAFIKSGAPIEDIALGFQQAATVARAAGIPIKDLSTVLALLNRNLIRGSDAGTSFRTFLLRLRSPESKEAGRALRELGIRAFDAAGNFRPLPEIIGQFSTALAGLTERQRAGLLQDIFGQDAIRAAEVLFATGREGFESLRSGIEVSGDAARIAAAKNAGLRGSIDAVKSSIETAALAIGESMAPAIEQLAADLGEKIPGAAQKTVAAIQLTSDTIGGLSDALTKEDESKFSEFFQAIGGAAFDAGVKTEGLLEKFGGGLFDASVKLEDFGGVVSDALFVASVKLEEFGGYLVDTFGGVVSDALFVASEVFDVFGSGVRYVFRSIKEAVELAIAAIKRLIALAKDVPNPFSFSRRATSFLTGIPFAHGGITGSGLSLVGEHGPELARFPAGTRIIPSHNVTNHMSVTTNMSNAERVADLVIARLSAAARG